MYDGASAAAEAVLMARRVLADAETWSRSRADCGRTTGLRFAPTLSALGRKSRWSRFLLIRVMAPSRSMNCARRAGDALLCIGDRLSQHVRDRRATGRDFRNRPSRRRAVNQRHRGSAGAGTAQSSRGHRRRYRGGRRPELRAAAAIRRSWRRLFGGRIGPSAADAGPPGGRDPRPRGPARVSA